MYGCRPLHEQGGCCVCEYWIRPASLIVAPRGSRRNNSKREMCSLLVFSNSEHPEAKTTDAVHATRVEMHLVKPGGGARWQICSRVLPRSPLPSSSILISGGNRRSVVQEERQKRCFWCVSSIIAVLPFIALSLQVRLEGDVEG